MQSIMLIGKISLINEFKEFDNDKKLLKFSVCENYMEKTTYFPCHAWGNLAVNINKFFKKGDSICLKLRYQTETYKDKEGQKKSKSFFVVESFGFLGKKEQIEDEQTYSTINVDDDELPF